MGDSIREQYDEEQDTKEEFLVEHQEETPLEIQDIQLEAGMPQDTENKKLCKHTQDAQKFQVTPAKGMTYINGTATRMTVCIENSQHPLIIDGGAHCSIVARNYLDHHSPNWENKLLPTKAKNFKSASGKMTSIGTIIKEIVIPHRKGNIRLNTELVVLEDAVETMEIHSLGPQYCISMPYPISGNLVISIIIGKIGHYGHFIIWVHPGPFTIIRPFLASFCFWAILGIFQSTGKIQPKKLYLDF
ncbi:hypothetical protein O181_039550 [Austropuccinia psidii MF-1]|uniref:Uncharacterized protein n=1 Tax=Austropuccinia psidii MF-1 TaxID=1389203 RepID=A0A9Q3DF37_9BASI|nr:hypothetical protein [Austropuccinia psidii MF-1]